jgi:hypothetical protein
MMTVVRQDNDRLQGTLDLPILKILAKSEASHGYAIDARLIPALTASHVDPPIATQE